MVSFLEVPVTDPRARSLLGDYFAERASTFPPELGEYQVNFPRTEHFTPPDGEFLLVLDTTGQPIGCGGVRRIDDRHETQGAPGAIRYELKHLWIVPRIRGTGAGRALLAELERRATSLGATELVLDTNASLEAATELYRRGGFIGIPPYNDNPNATNWYGKTL